ncbi:protein phosphatase 1 regulatory subunit 36 [Canis aureus]
MTIVWPGLCPEATRAEVVGKQSPEPGAREPGGGVSRTGWAARLPSGRPRRPPRKTPRPPGALGPRLPSTARRLLGHRIRPVGSDHASGAGVVFPSEAVGRADRFPAGAIQFGLQLGMWYWKDETRTLEFRSFTPAVELKEKGKKGKAIHFAETDGPAADRLTDKKFASRDDKSPKALGKRGQQGNVTLHDAKFVALFLLQDTEMQRICSFTIFMRNKNLDNFLMALLYYLSHYLEKNSLEKQPKSYMVGLVEKKEMELVINKLEAAQKYLAQKYCILVLGLAMPDKHHMCCGKEKISDTQKDWKFFESFYTFCTYVAWIVFRRQHFTEIEEEIGRLFRTNLFNIPRRKREDEESGGEKKRMTLVQFRRMMAKRPAIKKAIHMRSPVMSTLLPSLREKAQDIFEKKNHQVGIKFPAQMQEHMESLDSVPMPTYLFKGNEDICPQEDMYIAALFTVAPNWKQSKCLPAGEWVNCGVLCSTPYNGILLCNQEE